ncbi:MAG: FtsQ-type POTRA domain-containing protein [Deltaproteobacteria bacterium]|nr:FtsQ-type POTRA domain-containing protein [Deltaproteobacteria bacterium]
MRVILSFAVLLVAVSALLWRYPDAAKRGYEELAVKGERLLMEKQINISGLKVLNRTDIIKDLPLEKSIRWWQMHSAEIEATLERNVLVQHATLKRCAGYSLRCFDIQIEEREPAFITALGDTIWLIGADGGFITPIPRKEFDAKGANVVLGHSPILIDGLLSESISPDAAKARVHYVKGMIATVEPETGLKVTWVGLRGNGETSLRFAGLDLEAIFDVSDGDLNKVKEEAQRLKIVLNQFGPRTSEIARVDLVFDKVAVAKLKS